MQMAQPTFVNRSSVGNIAATQYEYWRRRNSYYYSELCRLFRWHVRPNARVLEVGCGLGHLLDAVQPSFGLGIDDNPKLIDAARIRYPHLQFQSGPIEDLAESEPFDYILLCNTVGEIPDVQSTFSQLQRFCKPQTRIIVAYQNALWEPLLKLASRMRWRRPIGSQNWLSRDDLTNLFKLADFEVVQQHCELLWPKRFPIVNAFFNRFLVKFWPWRHLGLVLLMIARPVRPAFESKPTVSVIIPTRNERGNIAAAIERTPNIGAATEIIFVDGWSTDGTPEEIARRIAEHPDKHIRLLAQTGPKGKGVAVRQAFEAATGDILMILDADLTVTPEDLPKFYNAMVEGKGEFINGTRLVYPMQSHAMRFINKCGNRLFSVIFTWLLGQRFRDTLCGTKAFTRANYQRMLATRAELGELDPFGDFDLIFGAARNDLKILEIPVRYGARTYGETNIARFRDGWLLLRMIWKAFWKLKLR
jgi:SAM-dependent methyltransferase